MKEGVRTYIHDTADRASGESLRGRPGLVRPRVRGHGWRHAPHCLGVDGVPYRPGPAYARGLALRHGKGKHGGIELLRLEAAVALPAIVRCVMSPLVPGTDEYEDAHADAAREVLLVTVGKKRLPQTMMCVSRACYL